VGQWGRRGGITGPPEQRELPATTPWEGAPDSGVAAGRAILPPPWNIGLNSQKLNHQ